MRVLLAGASGYIGGAVLNELLAQGVAVVALVRPDAVAALPEHPALTRVIDDGLAAVSVPGPVDAVISCIASRSGSPTDAHRVDYLANQRLLRLAESLGARRFLLLSAICVQKPRLAFQREKLRFEAELAGSGIDYTIVRPTAFFKSLAGQIKRVRAGKPVLVFGNGELTACKPIAEADLARYMVAALTDSNTRNRILPIGGPGPAITPLDQAAMLWRVFGQHTGTRSVSPRLFDVLGAAMAPAALVSEWGRTRREFMRIAKYYATESMLVWDAAAQTYSAAKTPETGSDTLEAFYLRVREGSATVPEARETALF